MSKKPALSGCLDLLLKAALAVVSPLLLIGLLEGTAYVWEQRQANGPYAWELVASRRMRWEQHPEVGDGYTLIQPGSRYQWQGIPVVVNAQGLRGPELAYAKPPATYRILNLGDSVAMGWGVREEQTYGRHLESILNSSTAARTEVINAAVPGWNLANELAYLEAEGLQYSPDLVLLDLTIANDINGQNALDADNYPAPLRWLRTNTYFWPFLTIQGRWLQARAQGRDRIDVIDPPTNPAKYFPLDPAAPRWATVWERIAAIQAQVQDKDAQFALILFPLEFQVVDATYPTLPQELLTSKAVEAGIPVVDLLPVFRQACLNKPGGSCQLEDRYLFADVWMHPSALGHQLAADAIAAALADTLADTQ